MANQKTRQQRRAEERERAQRLQSRQASSRRPILMAVGGVVGLVVVIAALVIAKLVQGNSTPAAAAPSGRAPAAVVQNATTIPAAIFNKVGYVPAVKPPTHVSGTPLKSGGKPLVVYVGADFCPYCAAERWALVAALSRFGTFHNLGATHSATADVYPNTSTFSFHGTTYTSTYLTLDTVEVATNQPQGNYYKLLEKPTPLEDRLSQRFDPNGIPFIYMGDYIITGPSYNPGVLSGLTMSQIASALRDPSTTVSEAILGTANDITAALCKETHGQPASVCASPGVVAAAAHLPK